MFKSIFLLLYSFLRIVYIIAKHLINNFFCHVIECKHNNVLKTIVVKFGMRYSSENAKNTWNFDEGEIKVLLFFFFLVGVHDQHQNKSCVFVWWTLCIKKKRKTSNLLLWQPVEMINISSVQLISIGLQIFFKWTSFSDIKRKTFVFI